jgi:hypothetical protein
MAAGYKEVRARPGFFGMLCRLCFWAWQVLMVVWLTNYSTLASPHLGTALHRHDAYSTGTIIGAGLSVAMIVFFWLAGSVIFGLLVLFTRGARMLVPMNDDGL